MASFDIEHEQSNIPVTLPDGLEKATFLSFPPFQVSY